MSESEEASIRLPNEVASETHAAKTAAPSYGAILRSTSIVGGSKAVEYLISMVRTKVVAVLLGTSGVGAIGLFNSSKLMVGILTGMGIGSAGVREIAQSQGRDDDEAVTRAAINLRRASWATGFLGWIVCAATSWQLSQWAFNDTEHAWLIAILGLSLLFTAVSDGQRALIQGTRRIGDLARMAIISSMLGAIVAISIYAIWGQAGIVPALISSAAINLGVSWWFASKIELPTSTKVSLRQTLVDSKRLIALGVALMWGALLTAVSDLTIRGFVVREFGLDGGGIYQAAWALSGMFAGFVIGAMGTDFYPRISALGDDHPQINRIVNEQIEIGILLALPGLLFTLFASPLVIRVFYSKAFSPAVELLPWFVLGIFCRVVNWPLGFVILAKGASRWFFVTQTQFYTILVGLTYLLITPLGMKGVGIAFFVTFIPAGLINLFVTYRLTNFLWTAKVTKLVLISVLFVVGGFLTAAFLSVEWSLAIGIPVTIIAGIGSIRGIAIRIGKGHRAIRTLARIPIAKWILPENLRDST